MVFIIQRARTNMLVLVLVVVDTYARAPTYTGLNESVVWLFLSYLEPQHYILPIIFVLLPATTATIILVLAFVFLLLATF